MKNKELRKQLETVLITTIETALNSRDKNAGAKTAKVVKTAVKEIARKFYKSMKPVAAVKKKAPARTKASKPKAVAGKKGKK